MNTKLPETFTKMISELSDADLARLGLKRLNTKPIYEKAILPPVDPLFKGATELELYKIGLPNLSPDQIPAPTQAMISERALEILITSFLHKAGIPAHIKGYNYIRSAIIMCVKDNTIIESITGKLYPGIAKIYNSTPSKVERAIRHAINISWDRGDTEFLCEYFGNTIDISKGKPTNGEFIAMIADRINLQIIA